MKGCSSSVCGKQKVPTRHRLYACMLAALVTFGAGGAVQAQQRSEPAPQQYTITAGSLGDALNQLATQSKLQIVYSPELVRGKTTQALDGRFTWQEALHSLLADSGLEWGFVNETTVVIRQQVKPAATQRQTTIRNSQVAPPSEESEIQELEQLMVIGTRIRGAPAAAPVIEVTQEDMRRAGHTDLGQAARSIPQNFPGGHNPGLPQFGTTGSVDLDGASNVNLRGLGPTATLTLLNGRRLAYGGANQGADISVIPMAAVERMEVVADGASALYGSDAVGGVVNVVLRRDFEGFEAMGLVGGATSGGHDRRQFTAIGGHTWSGGGIMVGGGLNRTSEIAAGQRSYTSAMFPTATLYPEAKTWNVIGSANQALWTGASFRIDSLYNERSFSHSLPGTALADARVQGRIADTVSRSFVISPSVDVAVGAGWTVSPELTHARDRVYIDTDIFQGGALIRNSPLEYDNQTTVWEVNAEGPLISLPAGSARLAVGAGHRSVGLDRETSTNAGPVDARTWSQDSRYLYGEAFIPIVGARQSISGIHRLSFSAAIRYEDYPDVGDIATPKLSLIYAPLSGLTLSGTWGKSFKAPTLFDRFQGTSALLATAGFFGETDLPPTATTIYLQQGNPGLQPERSTNWTASAADLPPTSGPLAT